MRKYSFTHIIAVLLYNNTWLSKWIPDKTYLKIVFRGMVGKSLDIKNPKTFNEKLQWLKLYNRKPEYSSMVDKYEAKKYVAKIIGDEYIIPTYGVWEKFTDIDFSTLPDKFVLKCTHDSGGLVICRNKETLDFDKARKKIEKCLKRNYFWANREWPYKNIKPRIIAEEYMEDTNTGELRDYKFFCFNGQVKCFKVDFDRFIEHHANYFTPDGQNMKLGERVCPPDHNKNVVVADNIEIMKELAIKLCNEQPFLRADFYDVDGIVYFGELTFFPNSGFGPFIYEGNDELLGSWIMLPDESTGLSGGGGGTA